MSKIELPNGTEELFRTLSVANLVGDPQVYPYKKADISLLSVDPHQVFPAAFYVLKDNLTRVGELYDHFLRQGTNILLLTERFYYSWKGLDYVIAPPIIEMWRERPIIVDGLHRFYFARRLGLKVTTIFIEGASAPLPVMPLEWGDVKVYNEVPITKRKYNPDLKVPSDFYRDFSNLGSGGERKISSNEEQLEA